MNHALQAERRDHSPRFFRQREWDVYAFGLRIGWYNLRTGGLRRLGLQKSLGKLLQPIVSPTRFAEYAAVVGQLPLDRGLVLDIGSPKIFGLWLAANFSVDIVATDLWALPAEEYAPAWRRLAEDHKPPGRIHFVTTDGTRTCFAAASFHAIFAISVIEHIPGDGDRRFLEEAVRLLVPGGTLVVTVPFGPRYDEEYVDSPVYGTGRRAPTSEKQRVFFQRVYDQPSAERRLMRQPQLAVTRVTTLALRAPQIFKTWSRIPTRLRGVTGFLNPLLSGFAPRRAFDGFPPSSESVHGDILVTYMRR